MKRQDILDDEKLQADFEGAPDMLEVLCQLADARKHGISAGMLKTTATELSELLKSNLAGTMFGARKVLGKEGFDWTGNPQRVVGYIRACAKSPSPGGNSRRKGSDVALTDDDMHQLELRALEIEASEC